MLILTRKLGESITIGDDIRITFLDVQGRHVRVGIEAPKNVMVHREEVYRLVREQNRRAASADMSLSELWGRLQGRSTP